VHSAVGDGALQIIIRFQLTSTTLTTSYQTQLTFNTTYKLTTKIDNLVGEFEYYTVDPNEYKTVHTYTFQYDEDFVFTLIIHSHNHYQDGNGNDDIQDFVGQWIGNILSTPYYYLENIPVVTEVTDVLTKETHYNELWDVHFHCFGKVDGKEFVPYEGHPVLV
jgi:hypothetical protein